MAAQSENPPIQERQNHMTSALFSNDTCKAVVFKKDIRLVKARLKGEERKFADTNWVFDKLSVELGHGFGRVIVVTVESLAYLLSL